MNRSKFITRAIVVPLDVSPSQERLLSSYSGAKRFAYNWTIGVVTENLAQRRTERASGVPEDRLTPAISWSAKSLGTRWNQVKDEVAPWWREVSMHAFRSGIVDAATALNAWSAWRAGKRKGRKIEFPDFKKRVRTTPSVGFVEINHQLSWLHPDRHHVRLMLPQASPVPEVRRRRRELEWVHTTQSTRRLYRLVANGKATVQKVTIAKRGGRWQASFQLRYETAPSKRAVRHRGGLIAIDGGVRHLITTSEPVLPITDQEGHSSNPNALESHLRRLRRLDRSLARAETNSKNQKELVRRRARLYGRIAKTRSLYLHGLTTVLAGGFSVVAIEDLNIRSLAHRRRRLGRRLADASLGELRRQLAYKTADYGHSLVVIGRFYPSSKTCSACGVVKAKLPLSERAFRCESCGHIADRDQNAARTIAREAKRLLYQHAIEMDDRENPSITSPGYDRETLNADRRSRKTSEAQAELAAIA